MKFWQATAYLIDTKESKQFLIQSPYDKDQTKEILLEVHPEYQRLTLRKVKRPDWVVAWEDEK
jgi:hypothetical protein